MELNRIIFPAPKCSYTPFTFKKMIWIPRSRFFSIKRFIKPLGESNFPDAYYETRTFKEGENIQQSSNKYYISPLIQPASRAKAYSLSLYPLLRRL